MTDRDRILPRFWSIRDKEYIYWDCYMQTAFNRLIEPNTYGLMYKLYKDRVNYIPEMPTGLRDKNGKLIYEGDIVIKSDVNAIGYSRTRLCKVHWHNDWLSWAITTQYGDTYELSEFEPQQYEVIGNIHENADLLKVGGK